MIDIWCRDLYIYILYPQTKSINSRRLLQPAMAPRRCSASRYGCCRRRAFGFPVHKISKVSELVSEDVISSMPDNVIANILDCLPLQDTVKTSILSRNWRCKWTTMLSQLVFDEDFFQNVSNTSDCCENLHGRIIISKILLQLKGVITKFSINIEDERYFEDIGNWVMFLSQKGIEEFTLINSSGEELMLPTHLFACQKLKHLKIENCCFPLVPGSRGFPNLLSLELHEVRDDGDKFGEFLKQSPLLEILKITGDSLGSSSILQLLGLCPKLQELTLDSSICKVEQMEDFSSGALPSSGVHPTIAGPLQLQKVVFKDLEDSENELCLIMAILTCSPLLKKMDMFFSEDLEDSNKFLKLQQAYPKVKIVLHEV